MNLFEKPVWLSLAGISILTVLAIAGAVLSRKWRFNAGNLSVISIAVYLFAAHQAATHGGLTPALLTAISMGIYDATAGWELAAFFRANYGVYTKEAENMPVHFRVIAMIIFSFLLGLTGYWLS